MAREKDTDTPLDVFMADADQVENALAELPGDNTVINVFRRNAQGRSLFLKAYDPDEFSLKALKETHGGGKFRIVPKVQGQIDHSKVMNIEIEGTPIIETPPERIVRGPNGLFLTKEEQEQANRPQPSNSMEAMMLMMLQQQQQLLQNLQNASSGNGSSRKEFLEEMVVLKNLFASDTSKTPLEASGIMEVFKQGIDLGAKALNGEPLETGTNWKEILAQALPMLQQAFTAVMNRPSPAVVIPPVTSAPIIHKNGGSGPSNGISDMLPTYSPNGNGVMKPSNQFLAAIQAQLPFVKMAASQGKQPEAMAETIANALPESIIPETVAFLKSEKWRDDLLAIDPEIKLQSAWFEEMRDSLLDMLESGPQGGNDE